MSKPYKFITNIGGKSTGKFVSAEVEIEELAEPHVAWNGAG